MEIQLQQLSQELQDIILQLRQNNESLKIVDADQTLAIVSPAQPQKRGGFGCMKGTFEIVGDIVSPAAPESDWEALQ
ncbi:hypothetical protein [[Limnothrix rosea] IAM M-220]|uniref:hypothetical protein n=1 Tax=[Limnothrix rosea] IAM M-220 TaxID=454133 RepID=UPI0009614E1D|nr:hypothetical protein [[Limnothrix rosea] IAM M-220]OKH12951.1 hypothetical protein NIES208_15515 [[Limnothrix rosea] IAM M-220]